MSTRINTNIGALNALKSLNDVGDRLSVAQLRLATGKRINGAGDDAAGYSIAKKFDARVKGLGQALNNIGSAKNLISVAEGHLNNIVDILTQMKTKATQAADDSLGTEERNAIKKELQELATQLDLENTQATWNSKSIFKGTNSASSTNTDVQFRFQIAAGSSTTVDTLTFNLLDTDNVSLDSNNTAFTSAGLRVSSASIDVSSAASAQDLMSRIDTAISDVSKALSYVGSVVNRLTYQESSLTVAKTNTESARSRIEDADMAYEQLEATKLQILQQSATAMLAQANTGPQAILSLFK